MPKIFHQLLAVWLVLLTLCHASLENPVPSRTKKAVTDEAVVGAAHFAVTELQKLSDTGIYTTLSLTRIKSAATQVGDFHFNTFLDLELASPHFKSGRPTESFSVVVMQSKLDDILSFAIDEFPVMDDDAIERFWIDMVERNRAKRRELFAEWNEDAGGDAEVLPPTRPRPSIILPRSHAPKDEL
ncbi:Aste57867_20382 [Aphanomyces stellatus]|uniref:Aste57867_20382 protein n=1 Tax=Aphanomyces stellatus TaxID=120398 RepID=A0A485LJJ4_9STRA|nr:hypothetical protein As57867_020316 [Aphanomyces stellatus]VFT97068.1 Aste57867_20382 [Aphanomyces stellatus]